jgi:hypothetical protein
MYSKKEADRYFHGANILRECGFEGVGDYWWFEEERMTFKEAINTPKVQAAILMFGWERAKDSVIEGWRKIGEQIRFVVNSPEFRRLAELREKGND